MKYSQALLLVCVGGVALAAAAPVEPNDAELVARKFAFRTPPFLPKLNKNRGVGLNSVSRLVDSIPISETPQTESTKATRELTDDDMLYLRGLEDNTLEARKTIAQLIRELRNKVHRRPTPALAPTLTPAPAQRVQESDGLEDNTLEARMSIAQAIFEAKRRLKEKLHPKPTPAPAPAPTLTPEPTSAPASAQRVQENGGLGDDALEVRMTVGQAMAEAKRRLRKKLYGGRVAPQENALDLGDLDDVELEIVAKVKPHSPKSDSTASGGKATSAIAGRDFVDDNLLDLRSLEDKTLEARMSIAQLIFEARKKLQDKLHPKPAPAPTLTPEPTSTPAPAQRVQESGGLGNDALEARMMVGQAEVVERDVRRCATKVKPYSTKSDSTASVGKVTSAIAGRNLMDDDLLNLRSLEDGILEERSLAEFRAKVRAMQPSKWKPQPLVPSAASSPVQRDLDLVVRAVADMFEVNDLD